MPFWFGDAYGAVRALHGPEGEDHGESAAGSVLGVEGAAHGLGEAAGDREAEADADPAGRVAVPLERFEDAVLGLVRDPVIGDDQRDPTTVAPELSPLFITTCMPAM